MDQALIQVGLPVTCAYGDCGTKGFVKPRNTENTDYAGWYKSKFFRLRLRKRWFCPEHYEEGQRIDNQFYENYKTPDPYPEEAVQAATVDELYKLLD